MSKVEVDMFSEEGWADNQPPTNSTSKAEARSGKKMSIASLVLGIVAVSLAIIFVVFSQLTFPAPIAFICAIVGLVLG